MHNVDSVFGFANRDFGPVELGPPLFSTHAHEIEDELLDFDALSALAVNETAAHIEAKLKTIATTMVPWIAVVAALQQMKQSRPDLPTSPALADVVDSTSARAWLKRLNYPAKHRDFVREWTLEHLAGTIFAQHEETAGAALTSGE